MSANRLRMLREVVDLPTAPFIENQVISYIRKFVSGRPQLRLRADRFGNLLVSYVPSGKSKFPKRPLLFAGHLDHPGFAVTRIVDDKRVEAEFRGWVSASFFEGERIQFFSGNRWVPAVIEQVLQDKPRTKLERRASKPRDFARNSTCST